MGKKSENQLSLVFSYLTLRKTIGLLGIVFPFLLCLGGLIVFKTGIQYSISSYYHTGMRDVFVGTLCIIGFFLLSYRGYDRDNIVGNFGCIFAVGAALFPITSNHPASGGTDLIGYFHFTFAALFFGTLIYFSYFLFPKTHKNRQPSRRKLQRNKVYKACGWVMFICVFILIPIYLFLPDKVASVLNDYAPVFWLETIAIGAFGISWLIKGQTILRDEA
jgi:hypothetical protein